MTQNINLITSLPIAPATGLSAKMIVQIVANWIVLLILIYIFSWWNGIYKQRTLVKLEAEQQVIAKKIDAASKKLASLKEAYASATVESLQNLPKSNVNTEGFYHYLLGLSQYVPNGIWLTNITFSQPNDQITLQGNAITAAGVPLFVNALSKSEAFQGKTFSTLKVQKSSDDSSVNFILNNVSITGATK